MLYQDRYVDYSRSNAVMVRQLDLGHILWCGRVVRVERAYRVRVVLNDITKEHPEHPAHPHSDVNQLASFKFADEGSADLSRRRIGPMLRHSSPCQGLWHCQNEDEPGVR